MTEYSKTKVEAFKRKKRSIQISGLFGKHKDSYTVNQPESSPKATRKFSVPGEMPEEVIKQIFLRLCTLFFLHSLGLE